MRTHIPDSSGRTYCGRTVWLIVRHGGSLESGHVKPPSGTVAALDLRSACIEDATCKACQRSDDRRVIEVHRRRIEK